MHPVRPESAYMRQIIAAAAAYRVDSFELCGDCHSWSGGLEGAIRFRDYPAAAAHLNLPGLEENIARLAEVIDLAHGSGRPIYYWHREVMVPRAVVQSVPGLLDENGEFNLLGEAYHDLIRSKVREFFDNLPGMDGLVLTVTESDYSVIHNSDPDRYPPDRVIAQVITTFADELKKLNKRFILRSFGSVAQDYEDILAGAKLAGASHTFEIETKITPYDFSPFLPFNPYLRRDGQAQMSAEYDSIGEFLGAGYLPAADPQRVIESVAYARARGVDRHTIRIDRIGHAVFASTQAVNLLAFDRAIADPGASAESVWGEWARSRWPRCADEMRQLMQWGIAMTKKTHFIDGHVIFHAFPIQPELKWIKSCGILSIFHPGVGLDRHIGMWGILGDRQTPASRAEILAEKDEAISIADEALRKLATLKDRLSPEEYQLAGTAWHNAAVVTRLIRGWCACVVTYFDAMEAGTAGGHELERQIDALRPLFAPMLAPVAVAGGGSGDDHEYGGHEPAEDSIAAAYARPLWRQINALQAEYLAERAERARWSAIPGIGDFVACGGLTDDYRVRRYMHASHSHSDAGRPARVAGNRVFPNGFIECQLASSEAGEIRLRIEGDPQKSPGFRLTVDGVQIAATYGPDGVFECTLRPTKPTEAGVRVVPVRIQKSGATYPWIYGIGLRRA